MEVLDSRIKEAKAIIEDAKSRSMDHPLIVNFSGGKDSTTVLALTLEITEEVELLYMKSGLELPGVLGHVVAQGMKWDLPLHVTDPVRDYMGDFAYWVRRLGYFPCKFFRGHGSPWCSVRLKLRPARQYFRSRFGKTSLFKLTGVRRRESSRRMQIYRGKEAIMKDGEHSGSFIVNPIINWSAGDVRSYLRREEIKVMKEYKSFGVSGCAYCPFYQPSIYFRILKTYPSIFDWIIDLEHEMEQPSVANYIYMRDIKRWVEEQRLIDDFVFKPPEEPRQTLIDEWV